MGLIKSYIKHISVALSILVLLGSIGVQVNMHICQENVRDYSFLSEAKKCDTMKKGACSTTPSQHGIHKENCCQESSIYEVVPFPSQIAFYHLFAHTGIATYTTTLSALTTSPKKTVQWTKEPPPLLSQKSIIIRHQVFLI